MNTIKLNDREYYCYLKVSFNNEERTYYYISPTLEIKVGDSVLVSTSNGNKEAVVRSLELFEENNVPYPILRTKEIIVKINRTNNDCILNKMYNRSYKSRCFENIKKENQLKSYCEINNGELHAVKTHDFHEIFIPRDAIVISEWTKIYTSL
ncbi:MAG: hypothetical protein ACOCRO_04565 [Halanaerobiales bacterium]